MLFYANKLIIFILRRVKIYLGLKRFEMTAYDLRLHNEYLGRCLVWIVRDVT